jgi:hypothetical protein
MTTETALDTLTLKTTELIEVCVGLKDTTQQLISDAIVVSENAAIIPLISMATNIIDTQTLLVTYITTNQ